MLTFVAMSNNIDVSGNYDDIEYYYPSSPYDCYTNKDINSIIKTIGSRYNRFKLELDDYGIYKNRFEKLKASLYKKLWFKNILEHILPIRYQKLNELRFFAYCSEDNHTIVCIEIKAQYNKLLYVYLSDDVTNYYSSFESEIGLEKLGDFVLTSDYFKAIERENKINNILDEQ